jgi:predicted membrane protein
MFFLLFACPFFGTFFFVISLIVAVQYLYHLCKSMLTPERRKP